MSKQQGTGLHMKLSDMFARVQQLKNQLKSNEAYCHKCRRIYNRETEVCDCKEENETKTVAIHSDSAA